MNNDMIAYYRDRAKEYERIYSKPERQDDIKAAAELLQRFFYDQKVIEVACGTGFWTEFIGKTATSVLATDINETVIEIAKIKTQSNESITYQVADLYRYKSESLFEGLFAGFIYSHVPKLELGEFFRRINELVGDDGLVVLMDNNYVEGSNHPITETDGEGNTYQTRKLDDGSTHRVLKNFPVENDLREQTQGFTAEFEFISLKYFWILKYRVKLYSKSSKRPG
jgi:2-polyprenyl-3-methyl-5-hydroxy-6-metoxy-1,4-benzoquinol methylase